MLVRFSVQNFLSFGDKAELAMFASRVKAHPEQVCNLNIKPVSKLLKLALIFGPNASGKSNLVKAMDFARRCIVGKPGFSNIDTTYFKLQDPIESTASNFDFEILVDKTLYRYGFIYDKDTYPSEWLYKITKSGYSPLYVRNANKNERNIEWDDKLFKTKKDREFYNFVNKGVPHTQLLLSELGKKELELFLPLYQWFTKLIIMYPKTEFKNYPMIFRKPELQNLYKDMFSNCDTGIEGIDFEKTEFKEIELQLPDQLLKDMLQDIPKVDHTLVSLNLPKGRYLLEYDHMKPTLYKLLFKHVIKSTGREVKFDFPEESDGTLRLFDLIPLLGDTKNDRVIVIDELDRSLHPLLTKKLITECLKMGLNNQSQLIATSHDSNLLDTDIIRRDAVWFVRKTADMSSEIYSLEEFKPRNDKELRNAYLEGLYGATPIFRNC